jgi:hypothetical protein
MDGVLPACVIRVPSALYLSTKGQAISWPKLSGDLSTVQLKLSSSFLAAFPFSSSLGAWVPENLARRNREVWLRRRRRRFRFRDFRFEAAAATLSATGSAAPRPDRNSGLRGTRVSLFLTLYAREALNGHRSARTYGVAWQREGSRQNSIGGPALTSFITLSARGR